MITKGAKLLQIIEFHECSELYNMVVFGLLKGHYDTLPPREIPIFRKDILGDIYQSRHENSLSKKLLL